MSKLILSIIVVALSAGSSSRPCSCQKALEDDLPHGANEDVEFTGKTVKNIKGRLVYYHDDGPADDVVVEIYNITEADKNLRAREITTRRMRQAACVTAKDGSFCFSDLPSGKYVIRAGTRSSAGMNEAYMRVTIDSHWWSRWFRSGKVITLGLTPGT